VGQHQHAGGAAVVTNNRTTIRPAIRFPIAKVTQKHEVLVVQSAFAGEVGERARRLAKADGKLNTDRPARNAAPGGGAVQLRTGIDMSMSPTRAPPTP